MPDIESKDVALMQLVEPKFLSLVKNPANRAGFKIVRSEDGALQNISKRKTVRKRADHKLISIKLPSGISEEDANMIVETFDLGADYLLETTSDGDYILRKANSTTPEHTIDMNIGNGFVAEIDAEAFTTTRSDSAIVGATVTTIRFEGDKWNEATVKGWSESKNIQSIPEKTESGYLINRHEVPESVQLQDILIEEGVNVSIARTESNDIPHTIYRAVIEQAYGNFGYGHIDFLQGIADSEFSRNADDAIYMLRDILDNILFYSALRLDERKALVQNALESFNSYISGLIDALPPTVVVQARLDKLNIRQEADKMATSKENTKAVERDDATQTEEVATKEVSATEEVTRAEETTKTEVKEESTSDYVTRSDLETIVADAVTAAMAKVETDSAARSDKDKESFSDALATIATAVEGIKESTDKVQRSVKELNTEVEDLGGATMTRSTEEGSTDQTEEQVQRSVENSTPFDGMFGDRFKH